MKTIEDFSWDYRGQTINGFIVIEVTPDEEEKNLIAVEVHALGLTGYDYLGVSYDETPEEIAKNIRCYGMVQQAKADLESQLSDILKIKWL